MAGVNGDIPGDGAQRIRHLSLKTRRTCFGHRSPQTRCRYPLNGKRLLIEVADALAEAGYLSSAGTRFTRAAVTRMLERMPEPK
jgi:hypothetical protein